MQQLKLNNNFYSGKFAEFLAKIFLILRGYHILHSRFVVGRGTTAGEIDIIAKRKNILVFVEVKKRKTIDIAKQSIFSKQKSRIIKSAEVFISNNKKYQKYDIRFDAICFNKHFLFSYITNAWNLD